MRLESALNAGREGITVHGQAISVIGDNIANANTVGFKNSRTEFKDMMSEGADGLQSQNIQYGGSGVALGKVRPLLAENGTIDQTGRALDAAIDGNGMFITGTPESPRYTRAGNFSVDEGGNLLSSTGQPVLGFQGDAAVLSGLNLNNINLTGKPTTTAALFGNIDASLPVAAKPADPASFNELAAKASFIAPTTFYDSLGATHNVTVAYFKTGTNSYDVTVYADGAETGGTANKPVAIGNSTIAFTENGIINGAASVPVTAAWSNGAAAGNFAVDLSKFTQFAGASGLTATTQDGQGVGNIKSYEIDQDGTIFALLDSGVSQKVGSIALASFTNLDGLVRSGSSEFYATESAGAASIGLGNTGARGSVQGGSLENSTVDLSTQFVNLVLFQRGYQANSQSLNAANDLLKATIQLMT